LNADYLELGFGRGSLGSASSRTKRMRTSFKHHQLRTMKSYFAINHNPDAKDLKQLSQKTGLPKRVLQVNIAAKSRWPHVYVCGAAFITHFGELHKFQCGAFIF
jgi:LIM homeobox protein 2/9